jgi:5-(carboxyamino)imidazole ribonucleotide mutase
MGTGKTGAANAALLAVQILAVKNAGLRRKLAEFKGRLAAQVEADSEKVKQGQ